MRGTGNPTPMNHSHDDMTERDGKPRASVWRRWAIGVSIVVHIAIATTLLFIYLPGPDDNKGNAGSVSQSQTGSQDYGAPEPRREPPVPPPAAVQDIPAEQIEKSIEAQMEQAAKLSDEEKLSELEKNLRRLESISDAESVQDVTTTIANTLGLDSSLYDPDKPAGEGRFDFDSAQLHDVTRQRGEGGQWEYQSILVDSAGRKMTVPMEAGEGETMFSTFEQMKKYPLAEAIYRGVVMPMLQSLIESEKAAQQEQQEAEVEEEPEDSDDNPGVGFGGGGFMGP